MKHQGKEYYDSVRRNDKTGIALNPTQEEQERRRWPGLVTRIDSVTGHHYVRIVRTQVLLGKICSSIEQEPTLELHRYAQDGDGVVFDIDMVACTLITSCLLSTTDDPFMHRRCIRWHMRQHIMKVKPEMIWSGSM